MADRRQYTGGIALRVGRARNRKCPWWGVSRPMHTPFQSPLDMSADLFPFKKHCYSGLIPAKLPRPCDEPQGPLQSSCSLLTTNPPRRRRPELTKLTLLFPLPKAFPIELHACLHCLTVQLREALLAPLWRFLSSILLSSKLKFIISESLTI